mmetsp:Transcript_692/g.909  ORF Transcript_692/g.909 Transcript_692/m.909 type:complete len:395 (+) Transcript_692:328-1512(+)|eukprot:CAMPEP_0204841960 /NCGR_PEP_ID=MMETSP1346-20131115/44328_1 /ASSEMBLY_ACC=CAM_ASM_000771 /TAXON_ID=215587 /ORGANISM="Aplanochytrium stocchinoi, Strain GSBS06" /LENGTH=394 /DNA_ID=CAMNT_0051980471 /DNA_START=233 /DNA_END=1417 /DNA_ORIENTATION=+
MAEVTGGRSASRVYGDDDLADKQRERLPENFRVFQREELTFDKDELTDIENLETNGQFSAVSKAKYKGKMVVLKEMTVEDELYAFVEMAILRDSANKHIVSFYGALMMDNKLNMVMELMERGDVKDSLKDDIVHFRKATHPQDLEFNWKQRLRVIHHTALALHEIHAVGVVHRDIKTDNLFLTGRGRKMVCKLGDFGFARGLLEGSEERAQTICGTEEMMAPEMIMNTPYSTAVDIWSFGLTLVELICGRSPTPPGETYEGGPFLDRKPENCFDIETKEIEEAVLAGCPTSLIQLVKQCLEYEPENRLLAGEIVEWIESLNAELKNKTAERIAPKRLPNAMKLNDRFTKQSTLGSTNSGRGFKTSVGKRTLRNIKNLGALKKIYGEPAEGEEKM